MATGTKTKLNVHEAKTNLSKYLDRIEQGESILLCRRNKVIAEIKPVQGERLEPRPIGLAKGAFAVPAEFFEPLPDDILAHFIKNA